MRELDLAAAIPDISVDAVFERIVIFERYPDLAPHVQSAVVHRAFPEPEGRSSWELHFRSGLLRWTEREVFVRETLPDAARIEFEQVSGDFDSFRGFWALHRTGPDCALRFHATFDFGIPSLEGILNPIAERVIKESVAWVITGLFSAARLLEATGLSATEPYSGPGGASNVTPGRSHGSRQPD